MTITPYGFPGTIRGPEYAKLHECLSLLAPSPSGVVRGPSLSAASGTRRVAVAASPANPLRVFAPGVYGDSVETEFAAADANSSGMPRRDLVVTEFNWATKTATLKAVPGTPAPSNPVADTPIQVAGELWQVVHGTVLVAPGATTFAAGDVSGTAGSTPVTVSLTGAWEHLANQLTVRHTRGGDIEFGGAFKRLNSAFNLGGSVSFGPLPQEFWPHQPVTFMAPVEYSSGKAGAFHVTTSGAVTFYTQLGNIAIGDVVRVHHTWSSEA